MEVHVLAAPCHALRVSLLEVNLELYTKSLIGTRNVTTTAATKDRSVFSSFEVFFPDFSSRHGLVFYVKVVWRC